MKRFDRLCKTIFESVKPRPSKNNLNRILKEDVNDANTPESITPEQRAIIEKVVAKLVSEKEDFRDTVEFAELDTDFFVALLDGCYEDWLRDEGWDDEQPDMFEEKPGFEEFAYDTIKYYLQDYDADNENTANDIWDNLSELEYKLYWTDMVAELKPQLEVFKAACKKLIAEEGDDTYYLDQALSNTDWWDENGLKYSPELGQEIKKYNRFFDWTYDHCFAGDDYNGWQIPDRLLRNLGLEDWYHSEDKDTPDLPLESKKVDTSKKVIKEQGEDKELGYVPSDDQIKEEVKSIMENVDFDLPLSTNWERLTRSLVRKVLKELAGQRFVDRDDFHYACYDAISDIVYANESKNVDRSKKVIKESTRRRARRIRK